MVTTAVFWRWSHRCFGSRFDGSGRLPKPRHFKERSGSWGSIDCMIRLFHCRILISLIVLVPIFSSSMILSESGMRIVVSETRCEFAGKTMSLSDDRPGVGHGNPKRASGRGNDWPSALTGAAMLKTDVDFYSCCSAFKAGAYRLRVEKNRKKEWELIFEAQAGPVIGFGSLSSQSVPIPLKKESAKKAVEDLTVTLVKTAQGAQIRYAHGREVLVAELTPVI